jgi:Acetyltransferases
MKKEEIIIDFATVQSMDFLKANDRHIPPELLIEKVHRQEIILAKNAAKIIGWLRFGYFWDQYPFINMLMILAEHRRKGIGRLLVSFWENEMVQKGFDAVFTSTLANEEGQHFYRKLGYVDSGCLLLETEPALEIIMRKRLQSPVN